MDERKKNLIGSPNRDRFKLEHKKRLSKKFWAADADLCLVEKQPPGVVAYLDYKTTTDGVTFSEVILYNQWMTIAPVYIVQGDNENGSFAIYRYLGGDHRPDPPTVHTEMDCATSTWDDFARWEEKLRDTYKKRGDWKSLRKKAD